MVVDPSIERAEPGSGNARDNRHADPILQAEANAALERWLQDHPEIEGELKETVRAHIHFQELEARTREAEQMLQIAEQRYATLQTRHDVAGHRIFGCTIGLALVVALVVLDAVPLNWAAQAFGLDSGGTWLVTCILVVASVGAMVGFELTSGHPRQRSLLAAVVGVAYLMLLGLRTQFLTTVAGESAPVALLQSAMLTAISAGLVLCGSVVLARTRSFTLSHSLGIVRRARRGAAAARIAQGLASQKLQRHIGALWQMLLPWALGTAAPAGVDRAKWAVALRQSVRQLFPVS
ncbi:MAG: hypothetical protein WBF20_01840 [Trebonia sp.]|jgi:hypothetical protein|uniref:hypothetical protein n=1 Tax=Trebonia sp. TaxID=2767075 RepID=UPI003BB2217F